MCALYNGHIEIVKKLIELGADINVKNKMELHYLCMP